MKTSGPIDSRLPIHSIAWKNYHAADGISKRFKCLNLTIPKLANDVSHACPLAEAVYCRVT
jgi:hypothetical protein